MRVAWALIVGGLVTSCDGGAKRAPATETAPTVVAAAPGDARLDDAAARRPGLVAPTRLVPDIGWTSEPVLYVENGDIYWRHTESGHVPRLVHTQRATGEAIIPANALITHAGVRYEVLPSRGIGMHQHALLMRLDGDRKTQLGVARPALFGKDFTFSGSFIYWTAPTSMGVGSLQATDLTARTTRQLIGCDPGADDCPAIVPGTPPLAHLGPAVYRLAAGKATRLAARCPTDPATGLAQEPTRGLGDHMLCEMRQIGEYDQNPALTFPASVLVSIPDGKSRPANGLGQFASLARGHWYHVTEAGIVRRETLDGADELVVALATPDSAVDALFVDDAGLVWIADNALWTAPLPPSR